MFYLAGFLSIATGLVLAEIDPTYWELERSNKGWMMIVMVVIPLASMFVAFARDAHRSGVAHVPFPGLPLKRSEYPRLFKGYVGSMFVIAVGILLMVAIRLLRSF